MNDYQKIERDLRKYKGLKVFIKNAKKKIELLENNIQGTEAITYDEISAKTNNINKSVENEVIYREEKIKKLRLKIEKAKELVERVDRSLDILNDTDKEILILKYMDNQPWFKISSEVSMSERQCKRNRNKAIKRLIPAFFGEE